MHKRPRVRVGIFVSLAAALLACAPALAQSEATEQEMTTAATLMEAHAAMGNLRALPGGCPAAGKGVVELATVFRDAGLPAPASVTQDGWGRGIMAWCQGTEWAVISKGADGLLADGYALLPVASHTGDDFMFIDNQRFSAPPHILQLMEGGKQKRTMADARSIATVFEAYRIDNNALPGEPTGEFVPVETIRNAVQPIYIRELPVEDAWGNPFWIWHDGNSYRIVSAGRDGIVDEDYSTTEGAGATTTFNSDIVMGDGIFIQWPEGEQS